MSLDFNNAVTEWSNIFGCLRSKSWKLHWLASPGSVCPHVTTPAIQKKGLWNSIPINPMTIGQKVSLNCVDFGSLILPPITKFSFCFSAVALFFPCHSWSIYHMVPCECSPRVFVITNFGASSSSFQCGCQGIAWALATDDTRSAAGGISLTHLRTYRYASLNNGDTFREMRR